MDPDMVNIKELVSLRGQFRPLFSSGDLRPRGRELSFWRIQADPGRRAMEATADRGMRASG